MRFFMKVTMPVEAANAKAKAGTLGKVIQSIQAELKPEAAYFTSEGGKRTAYVFFHMEDSSQIPKVAEPWFLAFNAGVDIHAAMNAEDVAKGLAGIERLAKKYAA